MRQATTTQGEAAEMTVEFLVAYLFTLNRLNEMSSRVADARNEHERRKSLIHLQNARKRCHLLRSLVFPRD